MRHVLLRAAGLLAIYLLVLTSLEPGDILVGGVLALCASLSLGIPRRRSANASIAATLRACGAVGAATATEMMRGTWRVARFCLGAPARPGLVEIPRGDRSRRSVALWGVLTGEAPDEVVVDVDTERDVLIVHLVDAGDPEAVRARHDALYQRHLRKVVH